MTADRSMAALSAARRLSHGEQLARAARTSPEATALRFEGAALTYAELDDRVTRLASGLAERGVAFGDRVAVLMANRPEVVETYLAASRLGAVAVPVNTRLVGEEVAYILTDSGARVIVVDGERTPLVAPILAAPGGALGHGIVVGGPAAGAGPAPGAESYDAVLGAADAHLAPIDVPESAAAFIMYTSGTTGRPKGAVLSHYNLLVNTLNTMVTRGISSPDEVWLSAVPLFHIAGLNGILPHLMLGATSVIARPDSFDPARAVDLLESERITGCFFVPSQWQQICAVPGVKERRLSLRRIVWGASAAPPSVLRAMADTFPGIPTYCAFGQTEMSSVTCLLRGADAIRKMGSVGTPVPNVEVRLVDDAMADVAPGGVGEIVYRGPTVFQGYWNNPEATAEAFAGGWFHSGDLCRMDDEGFIYVVDRKKDMIVSGGENIYCAEVEAVIDSHPKVQEVALIGVPHERWVETPMAVIVPARPDDPRPSRRSSTTAGNASPRSRSRPRSSWWTNCREMPAARS